jgi:2-oxoisovalerate dehydrogenase E1 component
MQPHPAAVTGALCYCPPGMSLAVNWRLALEHALLSRALDDLEETVLTPSRKVLYQFSARGHEVTQAVLAQQLGGQRDGIASYYRSRPLLLALGLTAEQALASTMMRSGSLSAGRDIGVVFNLPSRDGPCVLPACGGVGTQYTPAVGWAQAIRYHVEVLRDKRYEGSIAVAHGGEASTAANGFWAALNVATTQQLPILFYIEDNGYGISVPSTLQTPGGNVAHNLASFAQLRIFDGDGSDPVGAAALIATAVSAARSGNGPALLRLQVPRLSGHSGQDTQAYKNAQQLSSERARDPLAALRAHVVPAQLSEAEWSAAQARATAAAAAALERAGGQGEPDARTVTRFAFSEPGPDGKPELQQQGGVRPAGFEPPPGTTHARPLGARINMLAAIRRTLEHELEINPRLLVFGEDVGLKGGVHAATLGLQQKFGAQRVFDTSLSEEGIIGRAIGMAAAGLMPVPEIQFRKYAEPATEQLNDCGTIRWRTANRFAAPMVVRMPGGYFKCGDPWHSQSNEVQFTHATGWRLAMPSNAEDAVGLLRSALRGNDPTIFFEHRAMLDDASARRPYPGDDFVIPFGVARRVRAGQELTVITWGAMVERCEQAAAASAVDVELLDLRTLVPWDRSAVLASVAATHRCLIVHEDNMTAGFGAEIAAVLAQEVFSELHAPVERLAMPDIPVPHSPWLLDAILPAPAAIVTAIRRLASY